MTVNITRGPFTANVGSVRVFGKQQTEFQILVSRYGTLVYEQLENDFEEAVRVAEAYINWELDQQTDT